MCKRIFEILRDVITLATFQPRPIEGHKRNPFRQGSKSGIAT
ncbi:hypothetical protein FHS26_005257 [Rhizobium pisi]|uniref:Uncharacterized protein n=1 Tax=Rhizobium pisi TaxID=574561 RepID=A0A7W5G259_9HYPH|nr:hypothetical protein [Rhizobium pisi]MBB3137495.1 hypothetical protein [Rhizobium pisi]